MSQLVKLNEGFPYFIIVYGNKYVLPGWGQNESCIARQDVLKNVVK